MCGVVGVIFVGATVMVSLRAGSFRASARTSSGVGWMVDNIVVVVVVVVRDGIALEVVLDGWRVVPTNPSSKRRGGER